MEMSHTLRKRFAKDHKLPIALLRDPYFNYFIKLYDPLFESLSLYEEFKKLVKNLGGEEAFFVESERIIEGVIEAVNSTSAYADFNSEDISRFDCKSEVREENLYHQGNAGKYFVSIDLKHANFNSLRYINPDIVLGCESYRDLLSKFTDESYFFKSKHIRQIIFGHLNPKRQRKISKYLIQNKIIPYLKNYYLVKLISFNTATDDEVVLQVTPAAYDLLGAERGFLTEIEGILVNHTKFYLKQLGDKPYFAKEFDDHTYEFKAVPSNYYAECFRYYNNQEPSEYDFCSYVEGRVIKFVDPLF